VSWLSDFAVGAAQRLVAQGVGTWAPDTPTGSLGAGNIFRGSLPPDVTPGVGLQAYRAGPDDPQNPTTQVRLQAWLRAGTVAALDDLDAAVYDAFQGLSGVAFGTTQVTDSRCISSVPQGIDGNGNRERACNYAFELDLPATALRSY